MACYVRLMRKGDIPQVNEIDREVFSTLWPPPNYQRELENRLAHYLVAGDDEARVKAPEVTTPPKGASGPLSRLRRLFNRGRFSNGEPAVTGGEYILGFAGLWIMAGEAHITNIAVREKYHRQGIGELLLIALIDLAIRLDATLITLEVRASNTAAQGLYAKYGFVEVGVRRGYYTDNREDGVLMTLEDITSAPVQANLKRLKQAHAER